MASEAVTSETATKICNTIIIIRKLGLYFILKHLPESNCDCSGGAWVDDRLRLGLDSTSIEG